MNRAFMAIAIGSIASTIALAEPYTWIGGENGSWASPQSYSPNGTPGSSDTVSLPSGTVYLDASSSDELAAANGIGRIIPLADSVLSVSVADGEATALFAFTQSAHDGGAVGRIRKTGAGALTLASMQAAYVTNSVRYDYFADIEVREGALKLPQNATAGIGYNIGRLSVSNNASFFTLSAPSTTLTYTYVMELCGDGVITNSAAAAHSTGQVLMLGGSPNRTAFAGQICSPVRWIGRGSIDLVGTNSTMTSTFYMSNNAGEGVAGIYAGVMSFGKCDGTPSSVGTSGEVASRDEGGAFVYLGKGEETDKTLTVATSLDKPYPTYLSGGIYGGLIWTGTWNVPASDAAQMQQLVICGEGGTNVMRGTIRSRVKNGTNYTFHVRKEGKCTWRMEEGYTGADGYYQMRGGWTVKEGTLQFSSISETNFFSSLGTGLDCLRDVGGPNRATNRVSYGFSLGGDFTEGTMEYVGTADDICTERPIWLYGDGAFKNDGTSKIRFRGVSSVTPEENPPARMVTFTLRGAGTGENEILDITDSAMRPVSVVKEGAGTWVLGGEQSFHGALTVTDGLLIVRRAERYTWHRWTITSKEGETGASNNYFQMQEFALFGDDHKRKNLRLAFNGNYASLKPGEVAYGTDKRAVLTAAGRDIDCLFDDYKSDYGWNGTMRPPNATSGTQAPVRTDPFSWIPIMMRLPADAPAVTSYDVVYYQVPNHVRSVTSYFVDGSVDGVHWDRLSTVDALTEERATDSWQYAGTSFGAGGESNKEHTVACAIDSHPASLFDVLNNVSAVSVHGGAVLAAEGDVTIPGLAADLSAGFGTISNFTFAATGTVYLENVPAGLQTASLDWTLQDCDGMANIANWKVAEDGERTDRWRLHISNSGAISVYRLGLRVFIR